MPLRQCRELLTLDIVAWAMGGGKELCKWRVLFSVNWCFWSFHFTLFQSSILFSRVVSLEWPKPNLLPQCGVQADTLILALLRTKGHHLYSTTHWQPAELMSAWTPWDNSGAKLRGPEFDPRRTHSGSPWHVCTCTYTCVNNTQNLKYLGKKPKCVFQLFST